MARRKITVVFEIVVTDEEWRLNYGDVEAPDKMADHVDAVLSDAVREKLHAIGWGDLQQSTVTVDPS